MVRRLRGPERKKDGKVKRFLRYAALTASLMAGCAGGTANKPTLGNARPPLTNPGAGIAVNCKGTKSLAMGQEMWFGITWRSMYGMRVITFDERSVIVDMTVPASISSKDSDKLKTVAVRFNGVEMPRKLLEMVLRAACSSQSEAKSLQAEFTGPESPTVKGKNRSKDSERRKVRVKDDSKAVAAQMNKEGMLDKLVADMLSAWHLETGGQEGERLPMSEGKPPAMKPPMLSVVRSDENEFVLKVVGGPYDDKRLRLDRRLELSVETFSDKAVKVTEVQYRIVSLTSDSHGKLKATLSLASKTGTTYPY